MAKKAISSSEEKDVVRVKNLTNPQCVVKLKTTNNQKPRLRLLKSAHLKAGPRAKPSNQFSTAVVLFDGMCALCSRTVQFLLENDRHQILKFAPLQGETAKAVFQRHPQINNSLRSVIYIRDFDSPGETLFFCSEAILEIFDDIDTYDGLTFFLRMVPTFIRDFVYSVIAKYRYRWFGKYERCWLPQIKWTERFLP